MHNLMIMIQVTLLTSYFDCAIPNQKKCSSSIHVIVDRYLLHNQRHTVVVVVQADFFPAQLQATIICAVSGHVLPIAKLLGDASTTFF
jgi:hypothetical protein